MKKCLIIVPLFFIVFCTLAMSSIDFVPIDKVIEIIKLSSARYTVGYSAENINNYGIEFYVNQSKIRDFKNVDSIFKSNGINLIKDQLTKIHNFIAFISENPADFRHFKFNLVDVYNNLKYMDISYIEINYVKIDELIEIIKLSGKRKRKGYDARQLFRNEIVLYVDKEKVNNLNDFPSLFKIKNIELTNNEIEDIHNFIGFISEKAMKYKELKFNLIDVYNNLKYMN